MIQCFIGLGSNQYAPERQVLRALAFLDNLPRSRLLGHSSLWRSAPMGPRDQPDYCNAVAMLRTALPAPQLLKALKQQERRQGRARTRVRNAPRPLDLDLLLYGSQRLAVPGLHVPHPGLTRRDFVLVPLVELAPEHHIPGLGSARRLLAGCERHQLRRWGRRAPPA